METICEVGVHVECRRLHNVHTQIGAEFVSYTNKL
jgi:hypothetical protein